MSLFFPILTRLILSFLCSPPSSLHYPLPCLSPLPSLFPLRIDAAMLSAALFTLFHLSLALLFPNMALGIAAGLLTVYSNSVLRAVALQPLTMLLL
ncbi:unnamed protein product [Closterium sp. NIES-54]